MRKGKVVDLTGSESDSVVDDAPVLQSSKGKARRDRSSPTSKESTQLGETVSGTRSKISAATQAGDTVSGWHQYSPPLGRRAKQTDTIDLITPVKPKRRRLNTPTRPEQEREQDCAFCLQPLASETEDDIYCRRCNHGVHLECWETWENDKEEDELFCLRW